MSLAVKLVLSPLLVAQALATRRHMPRLPEPPGKRSGQAGGAGPAPVLRLLVAGDSSAAGVGVQTQRAALAAQLAERLAAHLTEQQSEAQDPARVAWHLVARSGLTTAQTLHLLQHEPPPYADVAVVATGVNDVVEQIASHRAVAAREALANWLRNSQGVQHVVFAPLPPVHRFPGLPQPLRWVAGADARRHNHALQRWAATRGDVSFVEIDAPLNRGLMAGDGFHPGPPMYRYCAIHLARHIATEVWPRLQPSRPPQEARP